METMVGTFVGHFNFSDCFTVYVYTVKMINFLISVKNEVVKEDTTGKASLFFEKTLFRRTQFN